MRNSELLITDWKIFVIHNLLYRIEYDVFYGEIKF